MSAPEIRARLEYLRGELRAERLSYGEIAELQSLAEHIDSGDLELLEAAGVPESEDDAIARIARLLDGRVWAVEDLETIANICREAGYEIREPYENGDDDA